MPGPVNGLRNKSNSRDCRCGGFRFATGCFAVEPLVLTGGGGRLSGVVVSVAEKSNRSCFERFGRGVDVALGALSVAFIFGWDSGESSGDGLASIGSAISLKRENSVGCHRHFRATVSRACWPQRRCGRLRTGQSSVESSSRNYSARRNRAQPSCCSRSLRTCSQKILTIHVFHTPVRTASREPHSPRRRIGLHPN